MSRAAGVDVGARKGCDVVIMDGRSVITHEPGVFPETLASAIEQHDPDAVAIDAPPGYAKPGTIRASERALLRRGIRLFVTPDEARGSIARYDWMRVGFACFDAVAHLFPRYCGEDAFKGCAFEVFPHATTVVLGGGLPDRDVSKAVHRRAVLEAQGVDTGPLRTIDALDAALCALTGVIALENGASTLGDPDEGLIVLPTKDLAERYVSTPSDLGSSPGAACTQATS